MYLGLTDHDVAQFLKLLNRVYHENKNDIENGYWCTIA